MDYNVIPNDNIVTFRCMFAGFPMPLIEWKFENGTSLPQNSQFQVDFFKIISSLKRKCSKDFGLGD